MNPDSLQKLLSLVEKKNRIDQNSTWSNSSVTYFNEMKKEIEEVAFELKSGRRCYLEDELGDVLWDYLNLLDNLQSEEKISLPKVFERALAKYEERINAISEGKTWASIKKTQKQRLNEELKADTSLQSYKP